MKRLLAMAFWKDEDGFSSRDFLMVGFVGLYLIEQFIAFIFALKGGMPKAALEVIQSLDTIVITIVGGTFGVQTVKHFTDMRKPVNEPTYDNEPRM